MEKEKINKIIVREDIIISKKLRVLYWIKDVIFYLIFILSMFLIINYVTNNFFGFAVVHGESMQPTYYEGQVLIVKKYKPNYQHGDIVIVDESVEGETNKYYVIKRIIGMPGDVISFNQDTSTIYINGEACDESYIKEDTFLFPEEYNNLTVPENCVFIMGDNRNNSYDSRDYGPVQIAQIVGKVE